MKYGQLNSLSKIEIEFYDFRIHVLIFSCSSGSMRRFITMVVVPAGIRSFD